jgi:PEP-CTERM motif
VKKTLLMFVSLLIAYPAMAGTIVTWEGSGEVTQSWPSRYGFPQPFPAVGTPLSVTLSFDPSSAIPTPVGPPGATGCMQVGFSGSMTLGGSTYTSGPSFAFTHAALPGSNCVTSAFQDGGYTQFGLEGLQSPPDAPWNFGPGRLLVVTYRDALMRDAFPEEPTAPFGADVWLIDLSGDQRFGFNGHVDLHAVDQTSPVPEPGTVTLLGLGLMAAYRRRRASQSQ